MNLSGWDVIALVCGWMMVFEGLSPLISPGVWRRMVENLLRFPDERLRAGAAVMVAAGVIVVWSILGAA